MHDELIDGRRLWVPTVVDTWRDLREGVHTPSRHVA